MNWRTPGRRLLVAAAAAVGFHLLLALGLGLLSGTAPPPPVHRPAIAVVLHEGAPVASPSPAASPDGQPGAIEPGPTRAPRPPRTRSSPPKKLATAEHGQGTGETLAREPGRGPLTKQEVAGEGLAREPGSAGVTTTLGDPIATLTPRGAARSDERQGPVHVPSREEQLVEEKTRVESMLHGWSDEILARGRARDPQDVYWRDMEEMLASNFQVEFEPRKREPDRPTSAIGQAVAAYQRAAESYGRTGSAVADPQRRSLNESVASGPVPAAERGLGGSSLEGAKAATDVQLLAQASFGGGWNKKLVVLIQIVQAPDGSIDSAQVTTTSGNEAYDGTALTQVRKLVGKGILGAPPSGRRRTVWAFETDFSTMPPLPVAGCTLDALFKPGECYYPFKRTVRSRIHLEAIY